MSVLTKTVVNNQQKWFHLAKAYALSTLAITASTSTGDFICQYLESKSKETSLNTSSSALLPWWNSERSLIMCKTAIFVSTPYGFMQARLLERLFPGENFICILVFIYYSFFSFQVSKRNRLLKKC